jgi:hypothetical protein
MTSFATEFPVRPIANRGAFVAQVISWLRGTNYSTVLENPGDADLAGDTAHLRSRNGEELRLRELGHESALEAIGFRHDFPDAEGRLWRTEAVLRRAVSSNAQDLVRLRTECIARAHGVRLDAPRKPYLIKTILHDGWGGEDGELPVSDGPHWLTDDDSGLKVACTVTLGQATRYLPVIYVSATGPSKWLLSRKQTEKLAYDIGGIAHVVVEPSRSFSFRLRDLVAGANAYGGTIGIALPGRGIIRRYFLGFRLPTVEDLLAVVREVSVVIRSQMPAEGWDWTELQEQALRRQRERDSNRLSITQTEELYREEIANLQDRVRQLEGQIAARPPEESTEGEDGFLPALLAKKLGPEIYPGEFSDRLRLAAKECSSRAEQIGLDRRSKLVLVAIATHLPTSPALSELREDLKRATKDPKRIASELTALLLRHGYREKADNKHIRLEAKNGYDGLDTITLPKTPSDHRGLTNLRKQIERTLGISKLSEQA